MAEADADGRARRRGAGGQRERASRRRGRRPERSRCRWRRWRRRSATSRPCRPRRRRRDSGGVVGDVQPRQEGLGERLRRHRRGRAATRTPALALEALAASATVAMSAAAADAEDMTADGHGRISFMWAGPGASCPASASRSSSPLVLLNYVRQSSNLPIGNGRHRADYDLAVNMRDSQVRDVAASPRRGASPEWRRGTARRRSATSAAAPRRTSGGDRRGRVRGGVARRGRSRCRSSFDPPGRRRASSMALDRLDGARLARRVRRRRRLRVTAAARPRAGAVRVHPAWAPFMVAAGLVLGRLPDVLRDHNPERQLLVAIGNSWFAVGPALVLALGDVTSPRSTTGRCTCSRWRRSSSATPRPASSREWLVLGVPPRLQLRMTGLVFLVDILLTPIGLLAAFVAAGRAAARSCSSCRSSRCWRSSPVSAVRGSTRRSS